MSSHLKITLAFFRRRLAATIRNLDSRGVVHGLRLGDGQSERRYFSPDGRFTTPLLAIPSMFGRRPRRLPRRELHSTKRTSQKFRKVCAFPISTNPTDAESAFPAPAPVKSIGSQTKYGWLNRGAGDTEFFGRSLQVLLRSSVQGRGRCAVNSGRLIVASCKARRVPVWSVLPSPPEPGPSRQGMLPRAPLHGVILTVGESLRSPGPVQGLLNQWDGTWKFRTRPLSCSARAWTNLTWVLSIVTWGGTPARGHPGWEIWLLEEQSFD